MTIVVPVRSGHDPHQAAGQAADRAAARRAGVALTVVRAVSTAAAAFAVAHLTIAARPATVCPLRALTGIPCPFCGGTTAAAQLGHGDVGGALLANPFVVVAGLALVVAPAALGFHGVRSVAALSALTRRRLRILLIAGVVFSEIWQLVRFGIL